MSIPSSWLPQHVRADGRYTASVYDANILAWPTIAGSVGSWATYGNSGWATASHTITWGPDAAGTASGSTNLVYTQVNDLEWYLMPQVNLNLPDFLRAALTVSGSPYTVL